MVHIKKINEMTTVDDNQTVDDMANGLTDKEQAKWEEMWNEYVPANGAASTLGGEILRAMGRLVYRFYNDGDTVDHYGGSSRNILYGANIFLMDNCNRYADMEFMDDDDYKKLLRKNQKAVYNYLISKPYLFTKPNDADFMDLASEDDNW